MDKNMRKCPKCGKQSYVTGTGISDRKFLVRRRTCEECGYRWTTAEVPYKVAIHAMALMDELEKLK